MQHLLPEVLREFEYYERKLPLYLRNDEKFIEHFRLWYELMMGNGDNVALNEFCGVSPSADLLLHLLNIYDNDFLTTVQQLDGYGTVQETDLLDKLATLFGLRRQFTAEISASDSTQLVPLHLTDNDLLTLIKAQIIRNYCDGTYEQVMAYYADANLEILPVQSSTGVATVNAYLNDTRLVSNDVKTLFQAGFLTIEHLGIMYTYHIMPIFRICIWAGDMEGGNETWTESTLTGGVFVT